MISGIFIGILIVLIIAMFVRADVRRRRGNKGQTLSAMDRQTRFPFDIPKKLRISSMDLSHRRRDGNDFPKVREND